MPTAAACLAPAFHRETRRPQIETARGCVDGEIAPTEIECARHPFLHGEPRDAFATLGG